MSSNSHIVSQLPSLTNEQLMGVVHDCEWRIGSAVAGGEFNLDYVNSQRSIISAVQSEFERREKAGI